MSRIVLAMALVAAFMFCTGPLLAHPAAKGHCAHEWHCPAGSSGDHHATLRHGYKGHHHHDHAEGRQCSDRHRCNEKHSRSEHHHQDLVHGCQHHHGHHCVRGACVSSKDGHGWYRCNHRHWTAGEWTLRS